MLARNLAVILATTAISPALVAQGFTPGRIHVTRLNGNSVSIVELTPTGQVARAIPSPTKFLVNLVLGPDGYLYVADGNANETSD